MIEPNSTASQGNFLPGNIPPGSEAFYNSPKFAEAQFKYLASLVSENQKALERGLQEIKKAINGET